LRWITRPINWVIAIEAAGVLTTLVLHALAFIRHDHALHRTANIVFAVTAAVAFLPLFAASAHALFERLVKGKK
jgi:hypothetical protein